MHLTRRRRPAGDAGFTLPELLIAVVILAIIAVPLGNAVIGVLRNLDAGTARMTGSVSAQISATYFAQDVETVGRRDYTAPNAPLVPSVLLAGTAGATCGASGTSAVVRFLSDRHDTATTTTTLKDVVVAWSLRTSGTDIQLVRTRCENGTVLSDVTAAHHVSGAPTVSCSSTCNSASPVPRDATLTFTVTPPSGDPYTVTLNGSRRQS